VNQNVKAIFKLRGNWDREELPHCAVLTKFVQEFNHVKYSALPSVEWQQRGRKHRRSFARLHHRRATWRSAVSLGSKETCGNSPSYVGSEWTEHHESTKGLSGWEGSKSGRICVTDGHSGRPSTSRSRKAASPQEYRN